MNSFRNKKSDFKGANSHKGAWYLFDLIVHAPRRYETCKPLNEQVVVVAGASSGTGGNACWVQASVGTSEKSGRRPVQAIRTDEIHFQTFVMQANGLHVQSDNLLLSGQAF